MRADCVLRNCRLVRPDATIEAGVAVQDGRIVMIAEDDRLPEADRVIDLGGKYVLPGCIDPHMHVDWPDWDPVEGTRLSTKAAAAGGYTTVINFLSGPGGLPEIFHAGKARFEEHSYVDMAFHMAVFDDQHIAGIPKAAALGASSFKFFLPYRGSEVVAPLKGIDDGIVYMGMRAIGKLGRPARAVVHCENVEIVFKLKDQFMAHPPEDLEWDDVRPPVCEIDGVRRVITFAEDLNCPVYVVHTSTREATEDMRAAKARGLDIRGETCVQYLVLTAKDYDRSLGKVNPPLRRDRAHCEALWQGLNSGALDTIGSDHAPCAAKHKADFWTAIVGMPGIQTLLPVLLSEGVNKNRISINKVAEVCSYNVARTFGLLPRKGLLAVGADADLIAVDLGAKFTVRAADLYHISDFSPYEGWELTGRPVLTMVRGRVVMEEGAVVSDPGRARYIPRYAGGG